MKKQFVRIAAVAAWAAKAVAMAVLAAVGAEACEPKSEMDAFIDDLMAQMTFEEKVGQCSQYVAPNLDIVTGIQQSSDVFDGIRAGHVGSILGALTYDGIYEYQRAAVEESRLGIPILFGMDIIHGHRTVFPIPLGLASSWDLDGVERMARISAEECTSDGISWVFSPMVDITRDARWGRVAEGAGEDPYLGSLIAQRMVWGYQGRDANDLRDETKVMACVKHFALYGASESGRDYNTVDMSLHRMYNMYFPPYKAAVEAGVGSVMTSFSDINGEPASGNKWIMNDVLRDQWGFNGFVVTDYCAIDEMAPHGMGDDQTRAMLAMNAGVDMEMVSTTFERTLEQSVKEGKVTEARVNEACRRVLEAKYKLGLFDDPYKNIKPNTAAERNFTAEHRAVAREIAGKSMVLLKNEGVLPLKKAGKIAVVGPLANAPHEMAGTWAVTAYEEYPTVLDGIKEVAGEGVKISYARGSWLYDNPRWEKNFTSEDFERDGRSDEQLIAEALKASAGADAIVAVMGESMEMSGEARSMTRISLPSNQRALLKALLKTGKPVVLVLFNGRPMDLSWEDENVPAILDSWFGGSEGGYAIADILFGDVNPSAKVTMSFPRNVGQCPIYYNHKNTGRPLEPELDYRAFASCWNDERVDPLYPFGYGLSYTSYEYSNFKLTTGSAVASEEEALEVAMPAKLDDVVATASVKVTNTGSVDGEEIVQLYVRDLVGTVTRPVKELKGFERVMIPAGESVELNFPITREMLSFYKTPDFFAGETGPASAKLVCEPGDFQIMVGPNSRDVQTLPLIVK